MSVTLPLSKMSTEDKLRAMEDLWVSLAGQPEGVEPPAWHQAALAETEKRIKPGEETFIDWELAKKSLRRRAK